MWQMWPIWRMWQSACEAAGDVLLGWMLLLDRDVALILLAIISAALAVLTRRWLTRQNVLRDTRDDLRHLRTLKEAARQSQDDAALRRFRATQQRVSLRRLREELRAAAIGLCPLALFGTWGASRLAIEWPRADESIPLQLHVPATAAGAIAHLVPQTGLHVREGQWVQPIEVARGAWQPQPSTTGGGVATWHISFTGGDTLAGAVELLVRYRTETYRHPWSTNRTRPLPTVIQHSMDISTRIQLEEVVPFGVIPGLAPIGLSPWLVGYLLVTLIAYGALRSVLSVA